MAKFRLDSIARLTRQMEFAPFEVRSQQIARAEELLHLLDPAKAYPLDFVIYRITDYRPKDGTDELLTGLALQHDLGLLIEQISAGLELRTIGLAEPVLAIEDVCERFNVTSKTIQRWRRKGLPGRRFVFPDGKRRVGFLLSSVEKFLARHSERVAGANLSQMGDNELAVMVRHARRLAVDCGCTVDMLTRRLARMLDRSPLTVLHTLKRHDQQQPDDAVLPLAAPPITAQEREAIIEAHAAGRPLRDVARGLGRTLAVVHRVVLDRRIRRLAKRKARFYDDALFHQENAERVLDALLRQEELAEEPRREELRVPRELPPYFQDLYRTPLLGKGKERALFLKLNYHKWCFAVARRRLDPELARHRDVRMLEAHLARAGDVKNEITRANLRLVVSVARKHLRNGVALLELVSEGNVTLMRAVESFDVSRGYRFSTYATLALMKGFARAVPQMLSHRCPVVEHEALEALADARPSSGVDRWVDREQVAELLSRLGQRERDVLSAHFGLDSGTEPSTYEQLGARMGLSKERIRQIERGAIEKLKSIAGGTQQS